jgi:hypothetical protein
MQPCFAILERHDREGLKYYSTVRTSFARISLQLRAVAFLDARHSSEAAPANSYGSGRWEALDKVHVAGTREVSGICWFLGLLCTSTLMGLACSHMLNSWSWCRAAGILE